ncbi:PREDICTED: glutamate receptor 2.8-like isoform X2 [Ipomoea nil]|uniref:glutamate receptor 2.8-like isoform X2 n=1 Tax=Ipomoea nil TaxID=35883 RepID=UPI000901C6CF|nr:PREDICTED: glutamate receptor 2.8-like isoform X2 [Ipomoea nil]
MRFFLSAFGFLLGILLVSAEEHGDGSRSAIKIGVVLDLNSPTGAAINSSMSMALSDFYSSHLDYRTRIVLDTVDVDTELDAVSAVLQLLNTEEVQGIVGSEVSTEAFVAELGSKAHVPLISLTPRSLSHVNIASPYTIQITPDDSYQAQAIASICKQFKWLEVVILYEDNKYGNQFNSQLIKALQEVDIHTEYMISLPPSAQLDEISTQLNLLKSIQTRVFLVHVSTSMRSHIFHLAEISRMMIEGYAWIFTTDSLSNSLSSMDSTVTSSWQGAVGIRPYVPNSENLENFKARWKSNMFQVTNREITAELNVCSLWAYDTTWALAMAIEKIYETMDGTFKKVSNGKSKDDAIDAVRLDTAYKSPHIMRSLRNEHALNLTFDFTNVRVSKFGAKLLREMLDMKFTGLSGEFKLVDYQLRPSAFEIFNVIGNGERTLGYWLPSKGIIRGLDLNSEELKTVIWPGVSLSKPKGWGVPHTGKLKIGVPIKQGFTEFVKVEVDPSTNETKVVGFSIDVFRSVLEKLPVQLDYEFLPFVNESGHNLGIYDDLVHKVAEKNYDVVVGDITILADRASYVDFTLPYTESGASMVVKVNHQKNMWCFLKPLTWDLWVTAAASSIVLGLVVWALEHGTLKEKAVALFMSTGTLSSNYSRFAFIMWLFIVLILTQSYTARLSALLTVDKLDDFKISKDHYVGYQQGSFVRDFLVTNLHINDSKLRGYTTIEQYHQAMVKGGKQGGIDAIFDEIPYIKLFLRRYGSQYKRVGPTYKSEGFGFAFPHGSPLVPHFSRAILRLIQSENMSRIENKYFGAGSSSSVGSFSLVSQGKSVGAYNFGAFFILNFVIIILALFYRILTEYRKKYGSIYSKDPKITAFDSPANDLMPCLKCSK